jgi:glycosyltransferase involved in cell wall biosynthesis
LAADAGFVRIAIVTETWLPSINGVVTRLVATVRELRRLGHDVLVVAPTASPVPDEPAGVAVHRVPSVGLPFIYGGQPWGLPLPRVVRLLDAFAPDVVHAVSPFLLGWAGVVHARSRGLPLVCSYHTHIARYTHFYRMGFAERPVWTVVRKAHQQAHVNLAASDASRAELEAQGVPDVQVWRGGVDLRLFHPRHASAEVRARLTDGHPERPLCLYVGRLAAEKGLERLLPLVADGSGRHLALVGDGPARAQLEHAFAGTATTFAGPLHGDELASSYATADLFVFPSTTDTFGLVLLEAMASGLPVVMAETPAARDLLGACQHGALFPADDGDALVAAAGRWLSAEIDRGAIADAVRRRAATWGETTGELLGWYEDASRLARRAVAA